MQNPPGRARAEQWTSGDTVVWISLHLRPASCEGPTRQGAQRLVALFTPRELCAPFAGVDWLCIAVLLGELLLALQPGGT